MKRVFICGTLALDLIGTLDGSLETTTGNVKLAALHEAFGGCAMNIAYGLARTGVSVTPLVYAGADYHPDYANHVARNGIDTTGIICDDSVRSARGILFTDGAGRQFTAFYPGPTGLARFADDLARLLASQDFCAGILAPDLPEKTALAAGAFGDMPLRIWCPGQYAERFDATAATTVLPCVDMVIVNESERAALARQGVLPRTLAHADTIPRVIVTNGAGPVQVYPDNLMIPVPIVPAHLARDPTGCGDAFVAGMTASLISGVDLAQAIRDGVSLAGRCLTRSGAQDH